MKNNNQAQEITIESLIGQILKKVDLYQHVIAQATSYMNKVKENKSNEAENISESGPRGERRKKDDRKEDHETMKTQSQIDSAA